MQTEPVYFVMTDIQAAGRFVIELRDAERIELARKILAGEEKERVHVQGKIVKEAVPYNPDWSFHLDPDTIDFFGNAIEVCDSTIKMVEEDLEAVGGAFLPGNHWCPWTSQLVEELKSPSAGD